VTGQADVIMGLEVNDFWNVINSMTDNIESTQSRRAKADVKTITISTQDLYIRGNYQDFQRFQTADVSIAADSEVTLPMLIEEVKRALTPEQKAAGTKRAEDLKKANLQTKERLMQAAAIAWDAQPITTARLSAEVWAVIKDENWGMVSRDSSLSNWPHRLWNFDKYHQFIGGSGGAGVGYGLPAALGGALGHKAMGNGVIPINFQNDGYAMFAPGALWTACHHNIPILNIMHNNRAYHQEVMHVQRMGNRRNRGIENAHIGTVIDKPFVDFAGLAKSMGMTGIGPISNPNDLGPALKRAVAMVKAKEPVLLDVITQPR
jgi:thiamine pyrophosphate-dependent acetolactate synthase large subunit-like protein